LFISLCLTIRSLFISLCLTIRSLFISICLTIRKKKPPELSDNPYDEETICHVTSKIVTPTTIENVYLQNMDRLRLDMSYHQYQSQPILAPICRFEAPNDHIMVYSINCHCSLNFGF
jgi:hypothetical protein